jgi:hypothetical protein
MGNGGFKTGTVGERELHFPAEHTNANNVNVAWPVGGTYATYRLPSATIDIFA